MSDKEDSGGNRLVYCILVTIIRIDYLPVVEY